MKGSEVCRGPMQASLHVAGSQPAAIHSRIDHLTEQVSRLESVADRVRSTFCAVLRAEPPTSNACDARVGACSNGESAVADQLRSLADRVEGACDALDAIMRLSDL